MVSSTHGSQKHNTLHFQSKPFDLWHIKETHSPFYSLQRALWWALATSPTSSPTTIPHSFSPVALGCLRCCLTHQVHSFCSTSHWRILLQRVTWHVPTFNSGLCWNFTSSEKPLTTLPKKYWPLFFHQSCPSTVLFIFMVLTLPDMLCYTVYVCCLFPHSPPLPLSYCPFSSLFLTLSPPFFSLHLHSYENLSSMKR